MFEFGELLLEGFSNIDDSDSTTVVMLDAMWVCNNL